MDLWSRVLDRRASRRRALAFMGGAATAALITACGGGRSESLPAAATGSRKPSLEVPDATIAVRSEMVAPLDTDAAIRGRPDPHYVAFPSSPARGLLFLFLPLNLPREQRLISEQAARNGFHVTTISFPNDQALIPLCGSDADADCYEKTHFEIVYGADRSTKVTVDRASSIENRLIKLLEYLRKKYPKDGWDAYLDAGAPRWSSIVAAGHAQGAGNAAFIAKDHAVARVAMFSGPFDSLGGVRGQIGPARPPSWLLGPHKTPSERYFAFGHARESSTNWEAQWSAVGLGLTALGPIVDVDKAAPPYGNSHLLLTDAEPKPGSPVAYGNLLTWDNNTPLTPTGQPLFAPVWQYMCFT